MTEEIVASVPVAGGDRLLPGRLVLCYSVSDPVAVRLEYRGRHWYIARYLLTDVLSDRVTDRAGDGVSLVRATRMPGDQLLLVLRDGCARWLLRVCAEQVGEWLCGTYLACPPWEEQRAVERELQVHLDMVASTTRQEGR
ncbi:MAG: SsgA family sporulation/cell division regulator [Pseudonocardiaceae bacterium]